MIGAATAATQPPSPSACAATVGRTGVPDSLLGLAEDALVISIAAAASRDADSDSETDPDPAGADATANGNASSAPADVAPADVAGHCRSSAASSPAPSVRWR